MATIQIRNVPDDVHATLVRRAKEAHMSLQEHLLAQLTDQARRQTPAEIVNEIRAYRAANPEGWFHGTSEEIVEIIRELRGE